MSEDIPYEKWKELLKTVPMVAVDAAVFKDNRLLLIRRGIEPFKGTWALPGGFLRFGETLEEGTKREVLEETGLNISPGELIGVYADPKRDPRGHVISIVFFAEARSGKLKRQESEIADLGFFDKLPANLTPSHKQIIYDALKKRGLEM